MKTATITPHDLTWHPGHICDWSYVGPSHMITRTEYGYMLYQTDHDRQPVTYIGDFDDIDEVLMVIKHDQKVGV